MSTIDLTPLYRTMVGFDRMANLIDSASRLDGTQGYPPYNIERVADDEFAIEIAVAGFSEDDLEIETNDNDVISRGAFGDGALENDAGGIDARRVGKGTGDARISRGR